jgi:glucarate dehydratase
MSASERLIRQIAVIPVAHPEPPLLFCGGLHQPWGVRCIVEVRCDGGAGGAGESYGDERFVRLLDRVAAQLVGLDIADLDGIAEKVWHLLHGETPLPHYGAPGAASPDKTFRSVLAPIEVACLDAHGRLLGRPIAELLGGRRRDKIPFAGYLFYRWDRHPGGTPDEWGAALDPQAIADQARRMAELYGFGSFKLKGGVFAPEEEIEALQVLHSALPGRPLRLDPNAAWQIPTAIRMAERLAGIVEYLEDPTATTASMAEVARHSSVPLATNMCVTQLADLPAAVELHAVDVVLADLHYWGGLRACLSLADACAKSGLGMSMHSSAHLGITLAAMLQLGAALPTLDYAFDTHWPWHTKDVVAPETFSFIDGSVAVPTGPGLGIELDRDALARMHEAYLRGPIRRHEHTRYLQQFCPGFQPNVGRW